MSHDSRILDLLDGWRDLPAYQLERRADVFFAAFLPQFLSFRYRTSVRASLIPEFPLRLRTLFPGIERKKDESCRLDYLALSDDLSTAYFIELKTDPKSRGQKQTANMAAAKAVGFQALIRGVLKVAESAKNADTRKYCYLLRLLSEHGIVTLPDSLTAALKSRNYKSAVDACLLNVTIAPANPEIKVVYLEPKATTVDDIGFEEFASWLDTQAGDPLAGRFSQSLKKWSVSSAGVALRNRTREA